MNGTSKQVHKPRRFRNPFLLFLALILTSFSVAEVRSEPLPRPEGKVILVVSGNVANTNAPGRAEFDWAMLKKIGLHTTRTTTQWTKGVVEFSGVLVRDVLAAAGASGKSVKAVALNDYAVAIPVADFSKYPVLMARSMNGKAMSIRDKGPLWIIYPADDFPGLNKEPFISRMIWQLKLLIVK